MKQVVIEEEQLEMLGEDFTDVVRDAVIVIEEGSDFLNLYVAVVRTFCWTLYAVYR